MFDQQRYGKITDTRNPTNQTGRYFLIFFLIHEHVCNFRIGAQFRPTFIHLQKRKTYNRNELYARDCRTAKQDFGAFYRPIYE
jgi:hypothetical protein